MIRSFGPIPELAFKQTLEDGSQIVGGKDVEEDRKNEVLLHLISIFEGAQLGSRLVREQKLFANSSDRSAFEAFTLVSKLLGEGTDERLSKVANALKKIYEGDLRPEDADLAKELIDDLLRALNVKDSFRPLQRPRDYDMIGPHAF